ncbi:ATP-grasp domain-containing protein [Micromonospora sp. DT4]|uniref:ATP-grasp domain-containing protein n=1 Tax=Micromonospora sp. DT4 TaxID=3393438 RepID=UPI003CF2BEEA
MTRVLVVGFIRDVLRNLDRCLPPGSVVVIEESEIVRSRNLADRVTQFPCIEKLVHADYVQSEELVAVGQAENALRPVDAVLPASEYAVPGAAALAEALGLPGAGTQAASIFRDKAMMRATAQRLGMRTPRWAEITDIAGVRRFLSAETGGGVLKPADRAGSVGVRLLDDLASATDDLWAEVSGAGDILLPARPTRRRFLVEERLRGPEYSVEMLVHEGEPIFTNVTAKLVWPGAYPVERGQSVPADLPADVRTALTDGMRQFAKGTGLGSAFLHGEWIVDEHGVVLIECAARTPGDRILELIELAYGFNPVAELVQVLCGKPPVIDAIPHRAAAIRYLHTAPGTVVRVTGVEAARTMADVTDAQVDVGPGDEVLPLVSSWERLGFVVAAAPTLAEAMQSADRAAAVVTIESRESVTAGMPDQGPPPAERGPVLSGDSGH